MARIDGRADAAVASDASSWAIAIAAVTAADRIAAAIAPIVIDIATTIDMADMGCIAIGNGASGIDPSNQGTAAIAATIGISIGSAVDPIGWNPIGSGPIGRTLGIFRPIAIARCISTVAFVGQKEQDPGWFAGDSVICRTIR